MMMEKARRAKLEKFQPSFIEYLDGNPLYLSSNGTIWVGEVTKY